MSNKTKYKGSKPKVVALIKKLTKDSSYEPSDEEHWLIDEYDRFVPVAKQNLKPFEKYYPAVWDELRKIRRMDIHIFEEKLDNPNYYLIDLLVADFIRTTIRRKDLKSPLTLQKLQITYINDRIILN